MFFPLSSAAFSTGRPLDAPAKQMESRLKNADENGGTC
jgi:hypothetical protein